MFHPITTGTGWCWVVLDETNLFRFLFRPRLDSLIRAPVWAIDLLAALA